MKRITLILIATLALIMVTVAPGASQSPKTRNCGHLIPNWVENVAQGASQGLEAPIIIARDAENGEIEVAGDCPPPVNCEDECRKRCGWVALVKDDTFRAAVIGGTLLLIGGVASIFITGGS